MTRKSGEAGTAETTKIGSVHEHAVGEADAPKTPSHTELIERLNNLVIMDEVGSDNPLARDAAQAISTLLSNAEREAVDLWEAIKHGDDDHRAWLREAITAWFLGQPVPEVRGSGNKEARISTLTAEVEELRAQMKSTADFAEFRIADGKEMGAAVWRVALEDVVAELRATLTKGEGDKPKRKDRLDGEGL